MSTLGFSPSPRISPAFGAMRRRMSPEGKALMQSLEAAGPEVRIRMSGQLGLPRSTAQDLMYFAADGDRFEVVEGLLRDLTAPEPEAAPPADIVSAMVADHFDEEARRPASADPVGDPDPDLPEPSVDRFVVARRSDGVELDGEARALLAHAQDLAGGTDFMATGEAMAALMNSGVHRTLGYADERSAVAAFLEAEVGVAGRKAMYFLRIGRRLATSPLRARIEAIGWTKAKEIAGLRDVALHEDAVAFAETNGVRDLVEHCRRLRDGEPTKGNHRRLVVTVTDSGATLIAQALDVVRRRSGKADLSDGFALQQLVAEWLLSESEVGLDESLAILEERHGVRLAKKTRLDNQPCDTNR